MQVLCTRKLDKAIMECAWVNDLSITDMDFISVSFHQNDALIHETLSSKIPLFITSVNAIKSILHFYSGQIISSQKIKCFCIEGKTARFVAEQGFDVLAAASPSLQLAEEVLSYKIKKLIYPCGNIRNHVLQEFFLRHRIECKEFLVYEKQFLNIAAPVFDAIMFFSPSQIDAFLNGNVLPPDVPAFCIGSTTAQYLKCKNHSNIHSAEISSEESMLQLLMNYFRTAKRV